MKKYAPQSSVFLGNIFDIFWIVWSKKIYEFQSTIISDILRNELSQFFAELHSMYFFNPLDQGITIMRSNKGNAHVVCRPSVSFDFFLCIHTHGGKYDFYATIDLNV